jgi:hypothetical protein
MDQHGYQPQPDADGHQNTSDLVLDVVSSVMLLPHRICLSGAYSSRSQATAALAAAIASASVE